MKKYVNGELVDMTQQEIDEFLARESSAAQAKEQRNWLVLRETRNFLLKDSDWTQVADAPVDKTAWSTYRQELRDLPANTVDPANPVWPVKPS